MEKFESLTLEKQNAIINSAMYVFGSSGYKKAFISEIAERARISKSMVFYYFGSKKDLYFYLLEMSFREISDPFSTNEMFVITDFFERIIRATEIKMSVIRKRPYIMKFLTTYYFDNDPEIFEEKQKYLERSSELQQTFAFTEIDRKKFKDTVNPEKLLRLMLRWTEGYITTLQNSSNFETEEEINAYFDNMLTEFYETFEMMRINFYKEEYLN